MQGCAFVQFTKRSAAEQAVEKSFNKLVIRGAKATIRWGKSQGKPLAGPGGSVGEHDMGTMSLPTSLPPPPLEASRNYFGLAGGGPAAAGIGPMGFMALPPSLPPAPAGAIPYPSQDPSRMGAAQQHF